MKIAILHDKGENASMIYRYFMPAYYLQQRGHTVTMHASVDTDGDKILTKEVREADICVMGMAVYSTELNVARIIKKNGIKLVYDSDDWYWDNYYVKFSKDCHESTKAVALLADKVTTCSGSLGDLYHRIHGVPREKLQTIPNFVPCREWDYWYMKKEDKRLAKKTDQVVIGIMGANNHVQDWRDNVDKWLEIQKKYGDKVRFEIMGFPADVKTYIEATKEYISNDGRRAVVELYEKLNELGITFIPRTLKMEEFYPKMCSLGWDIGIATLNNVRSDKGKSFLKYEDYGMARIPAVYRGIAPFTEAVTDGFNGLLANSHDEWINKISELVENPELREKIKTNALYDIKKKYDIETEGIDLYEKTYLSLLR